AIVSGSVVTAGPNGETFTLSGASSNSDVQVTLGTDENGTTVLTKWGNDTLSVDVQNANNPVIYSIASGSVAMAGPNGESFTLSNTGSGLDVRAWLTAGSTTGTSLLHQDGRGVLSVDGLTTGSAIAISGGPDSTSLPAENV